MALDVNKEHWFFSWTSITQGNDIQVFESCDAGAL